MALSTAAAATLAGVHLALGFSRAAPVAPLVFQGIAYSIYASALWPSMPLVMREDQLGSAYGLITAVQNLGLARYIIYTSIADAAGASVCVVCGGRFIGSLTR